MRRGATRRPWRELYDGHRNVLPPGKNSSPNRGEFMSFGVRSQLPRGQNGSPETNVITAFNLKMLLISAPWLRFAPTGSRQLNL